MAVGRALPCVYCGGTHASPGEIRDCWQRTEGVEVAPRDEPPEEFTTPIAPLEPTEPAAPRVAATADRGPLALGRNVLVAPGAAAPVAWADAPRVQVAHTTECALELQRLAHHRMGAVLEVAPAVAPEALAPGRATRPAHELGARFTFLDDELRHLLTSNSVDARNGCGWPLLARAEQRGARAVTDGRGDVELPDGTRAWLDGGPPRFTPPIGDVPVLHRIAVEHGSLRVPLGNDSHAELAPDQLAAVVHHEGAARIIAPAGSGKTRVLTERARHLLTQWRLPASAVCLVAFNKRAQEEMVARTPDLRGLQVRTLNAIALAVVNGSAPFAPRPKRLATIDEPEVRRLIGSMVSFPRKRNADPVATWIEALSVARLGLRSPADVEAMYDGDVAGFAQVFPQYRAALARAGQVDFDEQIHLAVELLLTDADVRAAAQRACRVLLVDEFQDLTPAHLLFVRLLAGPDAAVFGVGDDDQTIYGYNGADPAWLIDFADLFPGAGEHPLEVNYRCPAGIVRAADTLLRHNRRRVPKVIRAHKADADGFAIADVPDGDSLASTLEAVQAAVALGTPAHSIAVLTRVNSLLAPVQVALHGAGIPVKGGVGREFTERTAVRAALAWLRLATGGDTLRAADVAEAVRRPSRSMHPRVSEWAAEQTSVGGLRRLAARVNTPKDATTVEAFAADIEVLQRKASLGAPTAALLAVVFEQIGLAGNISMLDTMRKGMNRSAQNDDLTALAQLASLHPDPATFESWLRRALSAEWQAEGVTLATVHRVKGQEWPFVVVHHADAEQFPHRLATDLEEERRLFHVAITRASQRALVVPSDHPSPFILDCSTAPSERPSPVVATSAPKKVATATKPGDALDGAGAARFQALREWRKHAAAGKPAYTVFADATLDAIARANPSSLTELARIKGVGPSKLDQYGDAVLRILAE